MLDPDFRLFSVTQCCTRRWVPGGDPVADGGEAADAAVREDFQSNGVSGVPSEFVVTRIGEECDGEGGKSAKTLEL